MAKAKDIDFTQYIVPQKITENGCTITDKISILDNCERKNSLAHKSLSKFDKEFIDDRDYSYAYRLRKEYDDVSTKMVSDGFVPLDRSAKVSELAYSYCPTLTLELPFKVGSFKGKSIFGKIEEVKDGDVVYHTINVGAYPQSTLSKDEWMELHKKFIDRDKQITQTGKVYTVIQYNRNTNIFNMLRLPEIEYKGQRYVYDPRPLYGSFFKVEPLKFRIYDMTMKEIKNAHKLDLVCDKLFAGLPYYPNFLHQNCAKWQNSMIRAFINSANSYNLEKDPRCMAPLDWDFSKCGLLYEAFNQAREPLREVTFGGNGEGELIAEHALHYCDNIEKVNILPGVKYIGKYAFASWRDADSKLKKIFIPASVISIDGPVFNSCDQVKFENIMNVKRCWDLDKDYDCDFPYVYIAKDGSDVIFSKYEDESLEENYIEQQGRSLGTIKKLYTFYVNSLNPDKTNVDSKQESAEASKTKGSQTSTKKSTEQSKKQANKNYGNGLYEELE